MLTFRSTPHYPKTTVCKQDNILLGKKKELRQASFPMDLHNILQEEDSAIIGWLEPELIPSPTVSMSSRGVCKDAFFIRDPERFCVDIMPRYFSQRE